MTTGCDHKCGWYHKAGTSKDSWHCSDCGQEFVPIEKAPIDSENSGDAWLLWLDLSVPIIRQVMAYDGDNFIYWYSDPKSSHWSAKRSSDSLHLYFTTEQALQGLRACRDRWNKLCDIMEAEHKEVGR
jgi:hypothetical protein